MLKRKRLPRSLRSLGMTPEGLRHSLQGRRGTKGKGKRVMAEIEAMIQKVRTEIERGDSAEEIIQSISGLFGKDPETDRKVVESLVLIPHVRTAEILQRLLQVFKEKKTQKAIKRALYRLKSKGIVVEEVAPAKEPPVLRPLQVKPPEGFGSGIDSHGHRLLLMALLRPGRGWTVMQGVASDTQGFLDFSGEELTRKGMREFIEEIQKKTPFPVVEMDPSYVGFLFDEAYALNLKGEKSLPQEYVRFKREVEGIKKDYPKPPIYSIMEADEIAKDDWTLGKGGGLLSADVISTWIIEEDLVRPYVDAVSEAEESKIILSGSQKEVRYQAIYERALSELFSGERRLLYRRRLEEMAFVFHRMEKEDEARIALAAAIDLEKPLNPIRPNPFLLQLVIKSILDLLKITHDEKKKEPSFIIRP
jgi:hypothetical protein